MQNYQNRRANKSHEHRPTIGDGFKMGWDSCGKRSLIPVESQPEWKLLGQVFPPQVILWELDESRLWGINYLHFSGATKGTFLFCCLDQEVIFTAALSHGRVFWYPSSIWLYWQTEDHGNDPNFVQGTAYSSMPEEQCHIKSRHDLQQWQRVYLFLKKERKNLTLCYLNWKVHPHQKIQYLHPQCF